MSEKTKTAPRPLSPHLQIYKPMLSMMMSILHRLTGMGLYFAALLLTWWLMAAASGPEYYDYVTELLATIPGRAVLVLATWGFIHHLLGGVRHFIWDFGKGFDLNHVEIMARATLIGSLGLTALLWALI